MHDPSAGESGSANVPPFPRTPAGGEIPGHPETTDFPSEEIADPPGPASESGAEGGRHRQRPRNEDDVSRRRGRFGGAAADVRHRAERGALRGLDRLAEQLDDAAEHIDRIADGRLQGGAGDLLHSTAGRLEGAADYLRTSDLNSLRNDLEHQVRARPLQSVLLAVGAGWLLGKIMR